MNNEDTIEDISQWTPDQIRSAYIRMSQFTFNDDIDNIRPNVQQFLIEYALFHEATALDIPQIKEGIEKHCRIPSPSDEWIIDGVETLLTNKRIIEEGGPIYKLSSESEEFLKRSVAKNTETNEEFNNTLIESVKNHVPDLTDSEAEIIIDNFQTFIGQMMILHGIHLIKSFITRDEKTIDVFKLPDSMDVLKKILNRKTTRPQLIEVQKITFRSFFREESDSAGPFIESTAKKFFYLQILNIDPDCNLLQKESLQKKILILDTNILIGLSCINDDHHKISMDLIELANQLDLNLCFTKRTEEEFLSRLESTNDVARLLKTKPESVKKALKKTSDPFLRSYTTTVGTDLNQWSGFYTQIKLSLKKFNEEYAINIIDERPSKEMLNDDEFLELKGYVQKHHKAKTPASSEHDAFHIMHIKEVRKTEKEVDIFGPNIWFVSTDTTLIKAEEEMYGKWEPPSSVHISTWIDLMSKFIPIAKFSGQTTLSFFVDIIASGFPSEAQNIKPQDIAYASLPWIPFDKITSEDLIDILSDQTILERLRRSKSQKYKGEEYEAPTVIMKPPVVKKLELQLDQLRLDVKEEHDKRKELTQLIDRINKTVEEKTTTITELEKKDKKKGKEIKGLKTKVGGLENTITEKDARLKKHQKWGCILSIIWPIISTIASYIIGNQIASRYILSIEGWALIITAMIMVIIPLEIFFLKLWLGKE